MSSFRRILLMLAAATTGSGLSQAQPAVPPAPAEAPEGQLSTADELFRRANENMKKGNYRAACPDYEESDRLDHKLVTRLRLADCYEHIGRIASAWETFTRVADEAKRQGKAEPEQIAKDRAAELRDRLPWLTIVVPESVADVSGLVIKRNDVPVVQSLWNKPTAVDPGDHTIVAAAPGKYDWRQHFPMKEAETRQVRINELDSLPMSRRRVAGLAIGGVGVVGVLVGSIAGGLSFAKSSEAIDECRSEDKLNDCPRPVSTTVKSLVAQRDTLADVSTGAFIVGGAALGTAAVLYFTAPVSDETKPLTSWQFAPIVTPNGAGVLVGRRF